MMDTPSARVHAYLVAADLGMDVIHVGAEKCPLPYVLVRQSGGDRMVAQIEVECWGKTVASATETAETVRRAMKNAQIGGSHPTLAMWAEMYVVPPDLDARAAIALRYNLPVYQEH